MSTEETIKELNAERQRAWEYGKSVLDRAADANRNLNAEERKAYDQADAEIRLIDQQREAILSSDTARRELEGLNEEFRRATGPTEHYRRTEAERSKLDAFFRRGGPIRELNVDLSRAANVVDVYRDGARGEELRLFTGDSAAASGGSLTIPTLVSSTIYSYLTASVAMRRMKTTVITREGGEPFVIPSVATHGIATQVASQDTAFSGTDATLGSTILNAFDSGQLSLIANDLIDDAGVNIVEFVGANIARAIGEHTATWYVTGSGTGQPQGVMTAIGGAGTISTGGSLIDPTVEKYIDLVYSVNSSYRDRGGEWLMRDLTAAQARKLRDGAGGTVGAFLWQPSPTVGLAGGEPDKFFGYPVFTDPNVASLASNAKIACFGDFSAYYIRDVRGLRLERSDDFKFDRNQVAFRGLLRTDGRVVDTSAFNILKRSV